MYRWGHSKGSVREQLAVSAHVNHPDDPEPSGTDAGPSILNPSLGIHVQKYCLHWALKSVNTTYIGLFGSLRLVRLEVAQPLVVVLEQVKGEVVNKHSC